MFAPAFTEHRKKDSVHEFPLKDLLVQKFALNFVPMTAACGLPLISRVPVILCLVTATCQGVLSHGGY